MSYIYINIIIKYISLNHIFLLFFFNDTATTEIYTLSLHDALPILKRSRFSPMERLRNGLSLPGRSGTPRYLSMSSDERSQTDRKSARLNSSHQIISYAVFCLKKKKKQMTINNIIKCTSEYK